MQKKTKKFEGARRIGKRRRFTAIRDKHLGSIHDHNSKLVIKKSANRSDLACISITQ